MSRSAYQVIQTLRELAVQTDEKMGGKRSQKTVGPFDVPQKNGRNGDYDAEQKGIRMLKAYAYWRVQKNEKSKMSVIARARGIVRKTFRLPPTSGKAPNRVTVSLQTTDAFFSPLLRIGSLVMTSSSWRPLPVVWP